MAASQAAATGEQFYVTHCATADSVTNTPGYGVRAATTADDPGALRRALEYPPYELPLEMWREKPTRAQAPRRLGRTHHTAGGVWVVHSVYLEKDTMNRDRSYFSHLLHLPTAEPAAVLESWAADDWITEYAPKATKVLDEGALPTGDAISAESLATFLSEPFSGPAEVSVTVCPARLQTSASSRRELVGRFLIAYLKVVAERDAGGPRDRLFVHAEPGLVAMLTYAAVRILPPALTDDLAFSTFEPAHRGLRDFKLATVIGTYLGAAAKGLDTDLVTARGYGLDTIHPARSSRELQGEPELPAGVTELIDLAARGEWDLLADVHKLIGTEAGVLDRVRQAVPLARAVRRLNDGTATDDDLLTLKADRRGSAILTQKADRVWAHLSRAVLTSARLRAAFKDWLAEPARLSEFRRHACELLRTGDLAGWDARWAVVREAAGPEQRKAQTDKARRALDQEAPHLPVPARQRLRAACAEGGAWPDHHLLAPVSPEELDALLAADVPADWQGYTCFAVTGSDEKNWLAEATRPNRAAMREQVRRHLVAAPAPVLAEYLKQAKPFIASDRALLRDLFRPFRTECVDFLGRLIDAGAGTIEPADWFDLLDELEVYTAPQWAGFLLKDDHLAKLLSAFKADPIATPVWDWGVGQLTPALFEGDTTERAVYDQLRRAAGTLTAAGVPLKSVMSPGGPAKLNGADTILAVTANPASAESLHEGELTGAFQAFGLEPLDGLRQLYLRGGFAKLDLGREPKRLAPFAIAFLACYPVTHEYFSARSAVAQWLVLSENCPPETRADFQLYLVREHIPAHWYQQTLDESYRVPLLPEVAARIRELIAAEAKPTVRYVPPPPVIEPDDDAPVESAAMRRARRKRSNGGGLALVLIVGGLLAIAGLAALIVILINKSNATPTGPESPPPTRSDPVAPRAKEKKDR